ncbi:MAG TPA: helix-turn-helix transcriptional regulator [Nakamurella sp.]|nr:helix-turn-helix transcriptional regulator [Nakamurella sp.]
MLPLPRDRHRSATPHQGITRAERGILLGRSRGLSNRDIGVHLDLSEDTVKAKARALYRKLGARDRAHAVALASRQQVLP